MSSNFSAHNTFNNNKRNNDSNLLSTKSSSSIKAGDVCVFENSPTLENSPTSESKKEVTQSTKVSDFSNQNTTDNALKAYETALSFIETSNYHVAEYTKSRDKCFFFLYAMAKKPITALTRIRVKELNNMIAKFEAESNQLKVIDSKGQEQTVDFEKYNLREDFQSIIKGKGENDFALTGYGGKEALHRITISRRLHKVLDGVSQRLKVPKERLEFPTLDFSKLDGSKQSRQYHNLN